MDSICDSIFNQLLNPIRIKLHCLNDQIVAAIVVRVRAQKQCGIISAILITNSQYGAAQRRHAFLNNIHPKMHFHLIADGQLAFNQSICRQYVHWPSRINIASIIHSLIPRHVINQCIVCQSVATFIFFTRCGYRRCCWLRRGVLGWIGCWKECRFYGGI